MSTSVERFREFVKKHPKLVELVRNKSRTWQSLYEDWIILGSNDASWTPFSDSNVSENNSVENNDENITINNEKSTFESTEKSSSNNLELVNGILSLVKSINTDSINKALTMTQKASQIIQGFSSLKGNNKSNSVINHYDPFFRKF